MRPFPPARAEIPPTTTAMLLWCRSSKDLRQESESGLRPLLYWEPRSRGSVYQHPRQGINAAILQPSEITDKPYFYSSTLQILKAPPD